MCFTSNMLIVSDIDECDELRVDCGTGKRCFNRRGDYECLDINCPENYDRDPENG